MADLSSLNVAINVTGSEQAVAKFSKLLAAAMAAGQGVEKAGQQASSAAAGFDRAGSSASNAARSFSQAKSASAEFNDELLKFGRTMASFAALYYTMQNFFGLYTVGLQFNQVIEDSRVGVAGLLSSLYEYRDVTGNVVTGIKAFNFAQQDATKIQEELRISAVTTKATYEELLFTLQNAVLPATQAGIQFEHLGKFVERFAQVMQIANVPMNQVNEELRSFLQGTMQARMTRVMPFMAGVGLTNEKIKELIANGKFWEEFLKRTATVEIMATEGAKNYTTALSNLKDAFSQAMGVGTKSSFEALKQLFLDLTFSIVKIKTQFDSAGNVISKSLEIRPEFLSAVEFIDERFTSLIHKVERLGQALKEFGEANPTLMAVGKTIGDIVVSTTAWIALLSSAFLLFTWIGSKIVGVWKQVLGIGTAGGGLSGLLGKPSEATMARTVAGGGATALVKPPMGFAGFTPTQGPIVTAEAVANMEAMNTAAKGSGVLGWLSKLAALGRAGNIALGLLANAFIYLAGPKVVEGLGKLVSYLGSFEYKGKKLSDWAEDFGTDIVAAFAKVGVDLPKMGAALNKWYEDSSAALKKYEEERWTEGPFKIFKALQDMFTQEEDPFTRWSAGLSNFVTTAKQMLSDLSKELTGLTPSDMWTQFKASGEATLEGLKRVWSGFTEGLTTEWEDMTELQQVYYTRRMQESLPFAIGAAFKLVGDMIVSALSQAFEDVKRFGEVMVSGVMESVTAAWNAAADWAKSQVNAFIDWVKGLFPFSVDMFINIIPREGGGGGGGFFDIGRTVLNEVGIGGMSKARRAELTGTTEVPTFPYAPTASRQYQGRLGMAGANNWLAAQKTYGVGGIATPQAYTSWWQGGASRADLLFGSYAPEPYKRTAKPPPPGGGKGGGGGSEDAEARRLLSIYDSLNKDIARLSEGRLSEVNALEQKTNDQIMNRTEVRVVTEAELIELNHRRAILQKQKLEEDYAVWSGKIAGDVQQEWIAQAAKYLQDWKGFKDVEAKTVEDFNRKVHAYNQKQIQAVAEGQKTYLSALEAVTPLLSDQLAIQDLLLQKDHERAVAKLEQQREEKEIGEKTYETLKIMEAQTFELQKQAQERKKWQTEGAIGGLKEWAFARQAEAEQRPYKDMLALMADSEQIFSKSLSAGIISALNGTRTDWIKVGQDTAAAFIEKFITSLTAQLYDQIANILMEIFGLPINSLQTSAQTAAGMLAAGGAEAGAYLIADATTAAAILARRTFSVSGGEGEGGFLGGVFKPLLGLIGARGGGGTGAFSGAWANATFSALGNIFAHGSVVPFASGGVIGGKTYTPMALMGEAGPEAVMPLSRTSDGRLGVLASGMGSAAAPVNVVVNNNTGVQAQADVKMSDGQLEITLSRIVSKNIARGGDIHRQISRSFNVGSKTQRR